MSDRTAGAPVTENTSNLNKLEYVDIGNAEYAANINEVRGAANALLTKEQQLPLKTLPLAYAQRGMWVGEKIGPQDAIYNLAEYCEILGHVNVEIFMASLRQITDEAETTRAQIIDGESGPQQVIYDRYQWELPYIDFSAEEDPRAAAEKWMMAELSKPLDVSKDALWLSGLFKASDDCYYWYHRCHHIVIDGFGAGIIARRLAEIYNAKLAGEDTGPTPFLPLEEHSKHERAYRESARFERDKKYWLDQLQGLPEPISLTQQSSVRAGGLRRSTARLSREASNQLRELGRTTESSLPQVLIALFSSYIYRMTGSEDLVFGMPVSARASKAMRSTPCMMANAVSIRLAMSGDKCLPELMADVAKTVRSSLRHQQYRYEDLRRDLGLLGQGQQISWVGVNIEPFDYDLGFGGHETVAHNLSNGTVEDMTIFIYDRGDHVGLRIDLDANPALYDQGELDSHRDRFEKLIHSVIAEPEKKISQLDILEAGEMNKQMHEWNATEVVRDDVFLPALFEQQVQKTPDATALVASSGELSYLQLDKQVNRYAHALLAQGIRPGDLVAVALPRDEKLLCALLAIHKIGAAYLPLDSDAPYERLAMVMDEGRPALLLSCQLVPELHLGESRRVNLEDIYFGAYASDANFAGFEHNGHSSETPAYVIYTSGSTGRPKGVLISHGNLQNFLLSMQTELALTPKDRLLAMTTIAFDIAALELFLPIISGATVVIAPRTVARDPAALAEMMNKQNITVMQATPSHWRALLSDYADTVSGVRALVGGEALPGDLARQMRQLGQPVVNLYGPTETTIWSTMMLLDGSDLDSPPIGRPIANTQVYVLDKFMQPVPVGAVGELYIGGAGVAQGYLHRPELTAERFITNPFAEGRIYQTGDLVRWRADGVLEYLGRNDFQIKIRGYRVEAGDIESTLCQLSNVNQAVVTLNQSPAGEKRLVAFVQASRRDDGELCDIDSAILRSHLEKALPPYMVPSIYVTLEKFPLNVNGKIDRNALPAPTWESAKKEYVAPRSELESILAALWCEIFGVEKIGIHESFFDLGGDSLTAARMVSKMREKITQEIPLSAIFEAVSIAELADQLESQQSVDPLGVLLPIKNSGQETPVFCIHPVIGLSWGYAGLTPYLGAEQPIYGLQASGLQSTVALPNSIEEMAEQYLAHIRSVQAVGPYRLLGWSMGGLVVHEVARRLQADGEVIESLVILDAYPYVQGENKIDDEPSLVRSALEFMGFSANAMGDADASLSELSDFLCTEYDVLNLPFVREMQQANGDVLNNVRRIIENNLQISRRFVPGKVTGDVMFVAAKQTAETNVSALMHHNPQAWEKHVGQLDVREIDCHHQELLDADVLKQLGPQIANHIAGTRADKLSA